MVITASTKAKQKADDKRTTRDSAENNEPTVSFHQSPGDSRGIGELQCDLECTR